MSKETENYPIDFVVLWVDGSDPKWLAKKKKFKPELNISDEEARYREWGIFKYWFRAVEKYAPWVNHVYVVTDNQKPEWINDKYEKLTIVDHKEIINNSHLPTFNSQAIEMNLHNIPNLSEHFVYFNDDMYLGKPVSRRDFFKNGKPVETAILNSATGINGNELYARAMFNDTLLINRHFKKSNVINKNLTKWLNIKYGKHNIRTLSQLIFPYFTGYKPIHMPAAMLKETYVKLWQKEYEVLNNTTSHMFRHNDDVNQYIFSWWQLCEGNFEPKKASDTKYIDLDKDHLEECKTIISSTKYSEICINDYWKDGDFLSAKNELIEAFEKKLGNKSKFEK